MTKLLDLHPDFIKHAASEQFLWLGIKTPLVLQTPLAEIRLVIAKANARLQVTARAALHEDEFFTPERARTEFKANMVEESGQLDHESLARVMQLFQVYACESVAAHAALSSFSSASVPPPPVPLTPPARRPSSSSPVNSDVEPHVQFDEVVLVRKIRCVTDIRNFMFDIRFFC